MATIVNDTTIRAISNKERLSGGVPLVILRGGVPPGSPNPDPISDQKCNFLARFQTRPLKSIPVFSSDFEAEIMLSLLRLERKQKILRILRPYMAS